MKPKIEEFGEVFITNDTFSIQYFSFSGAYDMAQCEKLALLETIKKCTNRLIKLENSNGCGYGLAKEEK